MRLAPVVVGEGVEDLLEAFGKHGRFAHGFLEGGKALLGRQFTVEQQSGDLEEGGVLGQFVDRVAAVTQDALVTVDVGDGGLARRRVDEADVERDVAGLLHEGRDVVTTAALDRGHERELEFLAVDRERGVAL